MPNANNLKPFKKGKDERRNLKGAPKKLPEIDELLKEVLGEEKKGITEAQRILLKLASLAKKGNVRACEILLDRAYGKPLQRIEERDKVIKIKVLNEYPDGFGPTEDK